jgi:hypothetical protein
MGQVTMDLSELDKIREDLKKANSTIADKDLVIKEKDEEIVKVKADKRTIRITEKLQKRPPSAFEFQMADFTGRRGYGSMIEEAASNIYHSIRRNMHERSNGWVMQEISVVLEKLMRSNVEKEKLEVVTSTEYVNFDDVLAEINTKVEQRVASEIDGYKRQLSALNDTVTHAQINEEKAKRDLMDKYEEQIKKLTETFNKDYKKLQEDFEAFRTDKDTRTLEQKVKDLERELEIERNRKWYQRRKKTN